MRASAQLKEPLKARMVFTTVIPKEARVRREAPRPMGSVMER